MHNDRTCECLNQVVKMMRCDNYNILYYSDFVLQLKIGLSHHNGQDNIKLVSFYIEVLGNEPFFHLNVTTNKIFSCFLKHLSSRRIYNTQDMQCCQAFCAMLYSLYPITGNTIIQFTSTHTPYDNHKSSGIPPFQWLLLVHTQETVQEFIYRMFSSIFLFAVQAYLQRLRMYILPNIVAVQKKGLNTQSRHPYLIDGAGVWKPYLILIRQRRRLPEDEDDQVRLGGSTITGQVRVGRQIKTLKLSLY